MLELIPKAHAQVGIGLSLQQGGYPTATELQIFVNPLILSLYVLATVILLIFLIFGGLMFIINAGKSDKEGMDKGKNAITGALVGFGIVFSSFWLVQIIEFITGIHIFKSGL